MVAVPIDCNTGDECQYNLCCGVCSAIQGSEQVWALKETLKCFISFHFASIEAKSFLSCNAKFDQEALHVVERACTVYIGF